ncbi:hypothetical protein [Nonomuraea sp. NPDC050310]|uniref:hypothetical protein n=1 Tax=Nonomuraea sp. NPDC050310 TaxID=3154935 RepID=UPI0033E864EC
MDQVEPLQMPPLVLYAGKSPAFLLAWRRGTADGQPVWEARLAVPQSQVDVYGHRVHGLNYRWAPAAELKQLPGVDYSPVPRPAPGDDAEPQPLRMPPLVLRPDGSPAFLLAWQPVTGEGGTRWEGVLATMPDQADLRVEQARAAASEITKLPEADYSGVPAPGR